MTNLLHTAYTGLLAGVYHYKPGTKEIVIDQNTTVEAVDIKKKLWVKRQYSDNKLICKSSYKDSKRHGKYIFLSKNGGHKMVETNYKNGKIHGKYIDYPHNVVIDYKNDKRHGKKIEYFDNGSKKFEVEYKNGQKHGKQIAWDDSGNKIREVEYKDGVAVSSWK